MQIFCNFACSLHIVYGVSRVQQLCSMMLNSLIKSHQAKYCWLLDLIEAHWVSLNTLVRGLWLEQLHIVEILQVAFQCLWVTTLYLWQQHMPNWMWFVLFICKSEITIVTEITYLNNEMFSSSLQVEELDDGNCPTEEKEEAYTSQRINDLISSIPHTQGGILSQPETLSSLQRHAMCSRNTLSKSFTKHFTNGVGNISSSCCKSLTTRHNLSSGRIQALSDDPSIPWAGQHDLESEGARLLQHQLICKHPARGKWHSIASWGTIRLCGERIFVGWWMKELVSPQEEGVGLWDETQGREFH